MKANQRNTTVHAYLGSLHKYYTLYYAILSLSVTYSTFLTDHIHDNRSIGIEYAYHCNTGTIYIYRENSQRLHSPDTAPILSDSRQSYSIQAKPAQPSPPDAHATNDLRRKNHNLSSSDEFVSDRYAVQAMPTVDTNG